MKEILLNTVYKTSANHKKYSAMVDDQDFESLMRYKWVVSKYRKLRYAVARIDGKVTLMHNFLTGVKGVDHIDGNGLNNQRSNLRKATPSQNMMNKKSSQGSGSVYKGVWWHSKNKKWVANIMQDYKKISLGCFDNEKDAAIAYNAKAKELFGEYAKLNQI